MDIDLFITVAASFLMAIVAISVLMRNTRAAKFNTFVIMSFAIIFWIATNYLVDQNFATSTRFTFAQLSYLAPILVVTGFLLFSQNFNNSRPIPRKEGILFVVFSLIGVVLSFSGQVITGVRPEDRHTDIIFGSGYIIYLLYILVLFFWALSYLLQIRRRSKKNRLVRDQINFILLGTITPFVLILVINGIMPVVTKSFSFAKYTPLSIIFMALIIAYSIVKHRLFDIRFIVARSVTYLLSIVTIGAVYAFSAFWVVDTLFFSEEAKLAASQQTTYSVLAIVLAFSFQPIRRFFGKVTDSIFFKDHYDAQLVINSIGRILASEVELESLTTKVVNEIKSQMSIEYVDIVVLEGKQEHIFFDAGQLQDKVAIHHRDLLKLGNSIVVADNLAGGERKEIMAKFKRSVASPLRANKQLIGYLFLGDKLSGDAYSNGDIDVIKIIINELAVAVQNAKSYTEIQRFNETLQEKVTEATRKLRKANEELKSLDQAKDEFISMASHQLRTPLTTAKGYVSMVLDGDFGKVPSKISPPLVQALDSSNRMAGLINDLLNVSRMDAGKFFIDAVDVDLAVEVQGEVNQLANLAQSKNVTITYHPPKKKIPIIKLDLDKTRQVIMNIADNAVHYSAPPSGGGRADVYLELEGDEVVFKVIDNGIGVPDDIKPKLFAKFFRAGNAQTARPDGTGLGLYLVKRVVEDQGGTIIFESKVGEGSTFGFRMPIHNKLKIDEAAAKRLQSTRQAS